MKRLVLIFLLLASPALAQDRAATLADIRQQLTVLYVELQKLQQELSTTGGVNTNLAGTNALERIDAMEAELRRLTASTEELTNRVDNIVRDGTNRIGDLEFRLCELEDGCDIGSLSDTPTLGGGSLPETGGTVTPLPAPTDSGDGPELAISEREAFDRARAALEDGDNERAAVLFQAFTDTYQGGPLSGEAHLLRGRALEAQGLTSSAARAYLDSYSGSPNGPAAADALLSLGLSLEKLGQTQEACITLGEVTLRFPSAEASIEAQAARASMGCS